MNTLHEALELIIRCDADRATYKNFAGFNSYDSNFAHSLVQIPQHRWSERQYCAVYNMMRKYKQQLRLLNFDFDALPLPSISSKPLPQKRIITITFNIINISFPYDIALIKAIKKEIPFVRFNPVQKVWYTHNSPLTQEKVALFGLTNGFELPGVLINYLPKDKEVIIPKTKIELYPYQKTAVKFIVNKRRVLVGDDIGIGKTAETIVSLEIMDAHPALIVCPAMLKLNWKNEIFKWFDNKQVTILNANNHLRWTGTNVYEQCDDILSDFVIINYDILSKYAETLQDLKFESIIFDESHYIKERTSKRTKAAKLLAKFIPVRILLTGTPMPNRPYELISQLQVLDRLLEFGGYQNFINKYCAPSKHKWGTDIRGASNLQELHNQLYRICSIRRTKDEVLKELPEIQHSPIEVEIDNREEYQSAKEDLVAWLIEQVKQDEDFLKSIEDLDINSQEYAIQRKQQQKIQAAARAITLVKISALKQLVAQGKLKSAVEWIKTFLESEKKLVVFAYHISTQEALLEEFPDAAYLLGAMRSEDIEEQKRKFQENPNCKLIICSLLAASVGHTLTAASDCLTLEFAWTPDKHDQAVGRLHRVGQKNAVTSWFMVGRNTIDEWLVGLIDEKHRIVGTAIEGKEKSFLPHVVKKLLQNVL